MTQLMGMPLPDPGGIAAGGETRIGLYLVSGSQEVEREGDKTGLDGHLAVTVPDHAGVHSSAYMLLSRARMGVAGFRSDFVHEFFHVLADRYNTGFCDDKEY
jgi:hypothetical protein